MAADLKPVIQEIATRLSTFGPANLVHDGRPLELDLALILHLNLEPVAKQLTAVLGEERVAAFFEGFSHKDEKASGHLFMILLRMIPNCCQPVGDGRFTLNEEMVLEALAQIDKCVQTGEMEYVFRLRLTNVALEADVELASDIWFRKLPPNIVHDRYPIHDRFFRVSSMEEEHWHKHCVEVVISRRGKPKDMHRQAGIVSQDALVSSLIHPFLMSALPPQGSHPYVTHFVSDSPVERSSHLRGVGGISFEPYVLTSEDITSLRSSYAFLQAVDNDRVLATAVDRFILGLKQGEHHPNRVNEPHWDKIVDYVIAMETLFLTVNGSSGDGELSYRFRLNGSSLLSRATGEDVRHIFHALKHLYKLRSSVVHGSADSTISTEANKFIRRLAIENDNYKHTLGRMILMSRKLESWLRKTFFHLGQMKPEDRPYRREEGWEDLLWPAPSKKEDNP